MRAPDRPRGLLLWRYEVPLHRNFVHQTEDMGMFGELQDIESEIACVNDEEHRAVVGVGCLECGTRTWESLRDGSLNAMQS